MKGCAVIVKWWGNVIEELHSEPNWCGIVIKQGTFMSKWGGIVIMQGIFMAKWCGIVIKQDIFMAKWRGVVIKQGTFMSKRDSPYKAALWTSRATFFGVGGRPISLLVSADEHVLRSVTSFKYQ